MQGQDKNQPMGGGRSQGARSCPFWWVALACGCCFVGPGCAGGPQRSAGDPLVGGASPLPAGAKAAAAANQTASTGPVPAVPAPNSTASTAALASGAVAPADSQHNLQIGDARPPAAGSTWSGPPTAGSTVLQPPQPALIPAASRGAAAPASSAAPGTRLTSYEQARAQLQARGVTWFRLETIDPAGFQFSCSVPNRQNRNISRTYEAQASTELGAIQAAIEQIDKEQ